MNTYIIHHPWKIIEDTYNVHNNKISESLFSIGNGKMGQRATFEEFYSGDTMLGSYIGGVYYPDKTKVGWWKNGYPEYFAKVLNSVNWIKLDIHLDGERLDLNKQKVLSFNRELDMQTGVLSRTCTIELQNGQKINIEAQRICSITESKLGTLQYRITSIDFSGQIEVRSYLDFNVTNEDSNYDEKFWVPQDSRIEADALSLQSVTKKTEFVVTACTHHKCSKNNEILHLAEVDQEAKDVLSVSYRCELQEGDTINLEKYTAITSSLDHIVETQFEVCNQVAYDSKMKGFHALREEQAVAWDKKWTLADIEIEGSVEAQQGIRFNIFQLLQTYTGEDARLNIGPKGFTGEKYGGSTYWDTEAYCLPFYLGTAGQEVARNLLIYRYYHLDKAIDNAKLLGFDNGAALYPMVTMNGEECHNEWEITFEEIHRNGAIAYAIYDYIKYTGDHAYLAEYGLEVLVGIARFWSQRVNFSEDKQKYVMLGVTGPNEYENNVNNNWYSNFIAVWCMSYAAECIAYVEQHNVEDFNRISSKIKLTQDELSQWSIICDNMYYPKDEKLGIFLQQDGFLDKDLTPVKELDSKNLPLNQKWSWDRILRSCYIKQADVLQGIYFFEDQFDNDVIERNFKFYEPLTVHESSLSPCVHSILAAKIGMDEKAYEMYMRTARLDLDNYNNDTEDGCHITSMAGTWLSIIKGFAGLRVIDNQVHLSPRIPLQWTQIKFKIKFRNSLLAIQITSNNTVVTLMSGEALDIHIHEKLYSLKDQISI